MVLSETDKVSVELEVPPHDGLLHEVKVFLGDL